jgi:uncharacterized NAD(P)/FAD-binding protein YdhS
MVLGFRLGWHMPTDSTRCIAIIGAGFSGTITAVNLLRHPHREPLRILLIDRDRHARGTAYSAQSAPHLLNVPAGRMSAVSAEPLDFLRFAQKTLPGASGEDFLPRSLYGDYLEALLSAAERSAPAHVRLERVRATVRSVNLWRPRNTFILGFQNGHEVMATEVVLAMGNAPPGKLSGSDELRESRRVVEDPWRAPETIARDKTVLMVGTGLTMADIVVSATQAGRGPTQVYAISRHGLVPPRQTAFGHSHSEFDGAPLLRSAAVSVRQLIRQVRQICRKAEQTGGDWREAITFVRTLAPRLWSKLPVRERRRFLRHARAYWDIHRHRLAPSTCAAINALREAGRLTVHAGRIVQLVPAGDQVRVTWRPRGQTGNSELLVDRVVNCTGPDHQCRASRDPLFRHLIAHGLIQPDVLGIGLRTSPTHGVLNLFGQATAGLYYIGPMLRADHWEATAVHELREHAEDLAQQLALPTESRAVASQAL